MNRRIFDRNFQLDDFARMCLNEHADGYRAAVLWLATSPPWREVSSVARIWRDLHDGGYSGCDTAYYNADDYGGLIDYLRGGPHEPRILDGEQEMREINAAQGTDHPLWPRRAFAVSFDSSFLLGLAACCNAALKAGTQR